MRTRIYVDLAEDGSVCDAAVEWRANDDWDGWPEEVFVPRPELLELEVPALLTVLLGVAASEPSLPFPPHGTRGPLGDTVYGNDLETF